MKALDRIDLKILASLQEQGDLRMEELGERAGLSTSQASRRLDRLRREGYIKEIVAILNPERLGLEIKAYIMVGLTPHVQIAHAFHDLVKRTPEILECSMTTGDTDFLLKVQTRDLKSFRQLIAALTGTKQVAALKSSIVIEETKNLVALPIYSAAPQRSAEKS
jgi:Lrp/AsnC family transcriptional regulator, leucine-responsive regulatory protein